jgi:hypothetical protein
MPLSAHAAEVRPGKVVAKIGGAKLPPSMLIAAVGLTLMTVMLLVMTDGNLIVAIAPTILIGVVWYMIVKPLSHTLIGFFTICLLMHNPGMRPHDGKWDGPLQPLGRLVYDNLRQIIPLDALRFSAIEAILLFCLALVTLRWLVGSRIDNPEGTQPAKPVKWFVTVTLVTLFAWIGFGLARGGNSQQMLWQTRQIMWGPIMSLLFIHAFRTPKWHRALGFIIIGVAVIRCFDGIYFFYGMVKPRALFVEYSITHEDSMLLITTVVLLGAMLMERPTRRMFLTVMCILPIIAVGLVVNHRRLAYVSLAMSLLPIVLLMNEVLRKKVLRYVLIGAPVIILYITAGVAAKGESIIFFPIRSLVSVADTKNASNQTRDIENYNLLYTFRNQPLLGSGFGHEYTEVSVAYDISKAMPNYKYIAHNSVLWLLMLCGGFGFTGMWLYYVTSIFLGARVYRLTDDADTAIAALTSVCAIICYIFQAFGDMGMIGWMGALLLAAANSVIANSATRIGAWSNDAKAQPKSPAPPAAEADEEPLRAVQVG